ncbi:hypothetical protein PN36_08310 [Candidatus Thiomargarita nelsonii]|uniref:Uncharacterized protein n=1 Tax=Candidatus Thiomargarita nelsonii TaxID=1003181 RepID=A0A0A6PFK3_9GAMM|nr:hypothetical protein PN36_08310 [Candidatus Thiomargarita nelsonii]
MVKLLIAGRGASRQAFLCLAWEREKILFLKEIGFLCDGNESFQPTISPREVIIPDQCFVPILATTINLGSSITIKMSSTECQIYYNNCQQFYFGDNNISLFIFNKNII